MHQNSADSLGSFEAGERTWPSPWRSQLLRSSHQKQLEYCRKQETMHSDSLRKQGTQARRARDLGKVLLQCSANAIRFHALEAFSRSRRGSMEACVAGGFCRPPHSPSVESPSRRHSHLDPLLQVTFKQTSCLQEGGVKPVLMGNAHGTTT